MPKTRKLPVGFDPTKPNRRIGHVIPKSTLGIVGGGFIAVDAQKEAAIGRVVYLGRDVTSADILKKAKEAHRLGIPESEAIRRLDLFLASLEEFKIGHLMRCVTGSEFRLELVSEFSAQSKPIPLP